MKPYFEFPVTDAQEQERVIRVNIPATIAGGTAASLGYLYLARNEMLPDALTQEVLGDEVLTDNSGYYNENIITDENGLASVDHLLVLTHDTERELETFAIPLDMDDLEQTADQISGRVTDHLTEHPIDPESSVEIVLEEFDSRYKIDTSQLQFMSTEGAEILSEEMGTDDGYSFEAYVYYSPAYSQTEGLALSDATFNLQELIRSKLVTGTLVTNPVDGGAIPFTAHQYERLAQLAQDNGYGSVTDLLSSNYLHFPNDTDEIRESMDQRIGNDIDELLHEFGILTDQPSVLVRIVEHFPSDKDITIEGCQLKTQILIENYHHKEYDPTPHSLGIISVLAVMAAGIRYRQRRRVLNSERLVRLGLDGQAPREEIFEAVKDGTATTRQKLQVLKYQKAVELVDNNDKPINNKKRIFATSCGIVFAGILSAFGIAASGDTPDEKPPSKPPIQIVRESDDSCSSSDMIAVDYAEGLDEEKHYFIDTSE